MKQVTYCVHGIPQGQRCGQPNCEGPSLTLDDIYGDGWRPTIAEGGENDNHTAAR